MYKKCKVVMLSTSDKAQLQITANVLKCTNKLFPPNVPDLGNFKNPNVNQNLYILSDDEIKEGDWFMSVYQGYPLHNVEQGFKEYPDTEGCKKIIATTDSSLRLEETPDKLSYKSLPSIPQAFIDKYVSEYNKGNKIEKVMVEYSVYDDFGHTALCIDSNNTISIKSIKNSWTREEVIKYSYWLRTTSFNVEGHSPEECINEWIENNL